MQRDRDEEIGVGEDLGAGAGHPAGDRARELRPVGIFEPMRQRPRRAVLEPGDGAGARKHRWIGHRLGREEPLAEILFERRAETFAERTLDETHRPPAARAQGPMRIGRGAAGQTRRRVERIERQPAKRRAKAAARRVQGGPAASSRRGGIRAHAARLARRAALREGAKTQPAGASAALTLPVIPC